jgi:leader peptidase (prepilin peptidase)/N-methyltransferase
MLTRIVPLLLLFASLILLIGLALAHPEPLMLTATLAGLCVGSFLNVVVYRLPLMLEREWVRDLRDSVPPGLQRAAVRLGCHATSRETLPDNLDASFNLSVPRSRCPRCGHQISALENIPVLSFLVLKGQCRGCKTPISLRYPLVELLTGALTLLALSVLGLTAQGLLVALFCWFSVALALIDLDTLTLPDLLTLPLLWLGLIASTQGVLIEPVAAITGAAAGYGGLYLLNTLVKKTTGREGMGRGDFKLTAAIGAWVGAAGLPLVLLAAACAATGVGAWLAWRQRAPLLTLRLPFGPFLASSTIGLLLVPDVRTDFALKAADLLLLLAARGIIN